MKKNTPLFCLILIVLSCLSCNSRRYSFNSDRTFHRKKIAILPFQIHNTISEELPEGITIDMVDKAERSKCQIIQLHLYRYLLREYAKSDRKVHLQHRDRTNEILKNKGITYEELFELPKNKLAKILKVDALLYGHVYQSKKKLDLDGKEKLRNKVNNSMATVLYVYSKSKREKILWKDDRGGNGFPNDYALDMTKNLLRKAAKEFPF